MLYYLRGTLQESSPQHALIEVMGLGFYVSIPASFYFQLPAAGSAIELYTYLRIRDEEPILYGFPGKKERDFFTTLISVSGIGPKTALSLLGNLSFSQLIRAILLEDLDSLLTVPGIGKKTARRLIYELKDKIDKEQSEMALPSDGEAGIFKEHWDDVHQALQSLGYSAQEIARAKKGVGEEEHSSMEELFKKALAFLGKKS